LGDQEAKSVGERQPGNFLEDKAGGCDIEYALCLLPVGKKLAFVTGKHIVFDRFRGNATATLPRPDHALETVLLHLQQTLSFIVLFLFGKRLEGSVKVRLGALVHQHFVPAVLLQDQNYF
jgi:hypothetical protein